MVLALAHNQGPADSGPPLSVGFDREAVQRLGTQALDMLETCAPAKHSGEVRPLLDRLRRIYNQDQPRSNGVVQADTPTPTPGVPSELSADSGLAPLSCVVKDHIIRVYEAMGRNKTQAARVLEIDIKTLYNKLRRYGIS